MFFERVGFISHFHGGSVAVAAVTPRVRTIVICDDAVASPTEGDVFTLEGVRVRLQAERFPWRVGLNVYLLLSSPRKGSTGARSS
jgi:hypothetical protein